LTFAAAVFLAAIGAPLLMQGTVAFVSALANPQPGGSSPLQALLLFALSTVPMALAWFAWRRTQEFQSDIDEQV
jgi:hypothetical protein